MPSHLSPLALGYHGVTAVSLRIDRAALFTAPKTFLRQVGLVRRLGYRFVTFGELATRAAAGTAEGYAALTFDDGIADNLHTLLPLLTRDGLPATVFVVASWDGRPHPDAPWALTMTHEEVRRLADGGVEIGSHSLDHRDLSTLDYDAAVADWRESRTLLEEVVGRPVEVAAYPFGRVGPDSARACRDAGFRAAGRTAAEGSWDDPWNLPRQDMSNGVTMAGLWLKHRGWYEPIMSRFAGRAIRSAIRRTKARLR